MSKRHLFTILACATILSLLPGCATKTEENLIEKHVHVFDAASKDIFLVVSKPLKDVDDLRDPTQGVEFPLGKYYLEAQDDSYWYFRAPKVLVVALYDIEGRKINTLSFPGGIALSKSGDNTFPGPMAYVDDANKSSKVHLWIITKEFFKLRGDKWRLSSDPESPAK
jgi:hypothetical protein